MDDRVIIFRKYILLDDENSFKAIDDDYIEKIEDVIDYWFSKDEDGVCYIDKEFKKFIEENHVN